MNIFNNMTTYTSGFTLKTERDITKNDIITMCKLLNSNNKYSNVCEFKPEAITGGGIVYCFKDSFDKNWYKTVRLCVNSGNSRGNWYWINGDVMTEWSNHTDIIFKQDSTFTIFLKSFHGAPLFTLDELKTWEECFNQIGIVRVGKYPSKKSLID